TPYTSSVKGWSVWSSPSEESADYRQEPRGASRFSSCSQEQQWRKVVRSDQSKFMMFGTDGVKFVRRRFGARYHPRHRLASVKSGSAAVTVHNTFYGKGVGPFHLIEGSMGLKIYISITETVVWPYCLKWIYFKTGQ
ncbi:hypothetical protein TELCIR_22790, partial [Teladorsagia circumcincta]